MKIKGKTILILVIILSLLTIGCSEEPKERITQLSTKTNTNQNAKPIVMILLDSLMDKSLSDAIQAGRVPALQFLINHESFPRSASSS